MLNWAAANARMNAAHSKVFGEPARVTLPGEAEVFTRAIVTRDVEVAKRDQTTVIERRTTVDLPVSQVPKVPTGTVIVMTDSGEQLRADYVLKRDESWVTVVVK